MGTRGKSIVLGAVFALAAAQALGQGKLTGVETRPFGEGIEVQILGENLPKPTEIRVNGNRSYILQFEAHLLGRATYKKVHKGGLQYWNCVWFSAKPPRVRVLLQLGAGTEPVLTQNAKGWLVSLSAATPKASPSATTSNSVKWTIPPLTPAQQVLQEQQANAAKLIGSKPAETKATTKTSSTAKPALSDEWTLPPVKPAQQVQPGHVKPTDTTTTASTTTQATIRTVNPALQEPPSTKIPPTSPTVELALAGLDDTTKTAITSSAPPRSNPTFASVKTKTVLVSLDFVNAEVVQILKALALQANVNIVTAPEVKGTLTVTLDKVAVDEALDFVTTMSGTRYGRVGNTYMVTTPGKFAEAMRMINKRGEEVYETRVVPIFSGAGTQIKASILRSLPTETPEGTFEIVLPSEETKVEKKATVGEAKTADGQAQGGSGDSTSIESKTTNDARDPYVVLIGSGSRLTVVERMINRLDGQLCMAMGIHVPESSVMTRATYQVRGGSASELMKAVAGDKNKVGNVEITATPSASSSGQAVVLFGREHEVTHVLQTLAQLDSSEEVQQSFVSYDVKYVDPRSLREGLISSIPGLRASVAPAAAGNPRVYQAGSTKSQASETVKSGAGDTAQGAAATGGTEINVKGDSSTNAAEGLGQPFTDYEKVTVPMRLILSGTADLMDRAMVYLQVVDIAPKQIALELRVMEMTKEDALRIGLDWSLVTGGTVRSIRVNQGLGGTPSTPGVTSGSLGFAGGGTADITAMLDQIADKRNLIARPNILAIDGRESEIFVGDVVRYIESIVTSQNGTTVTTGEVPVGVRLAVFPRVGGSGSITMDLRPVVSSLKSFSPVPGGGNLPQTSVRIAQSTVNIKSGETIAIGGLIQDEDRRVVSGIPILKDLPIIGMLFRRTDTFKVRTEVVMFLTARIVEPNDRATAADPRVSEKAKPPEHGKGG